MKKDQEKLLKAVRKLDHDGNGLEVTMGVGNEIDFYYSDKTPSTGLLGGLKVEIVSSETKDKELLHQLLTNIKKKI